MNAAIIFGILLGLSYSMYRHAQKTPIDADNVNEEWDGATADTPAGAVTTTGSH